MIQILVHYNILGGIVINRHVLSILVENYSGVLSKIAGLFSRRGYNIDSLSVGETENPKISRMTIVVTCDEYTLEQIQKQLYKLIYVIKIKELKSEKSVYRELMLVKVKADSNERAHINEIIDIFRAKVIDISVGTLTIELTGDEGKIAAFIDILKPYEIVELVRTGLTGLQRGDVKI